MQIYKKSGIIKYRYKKYKKIISNYRLKTIPNLRLALSYDVRSFDAEAPILLNIIILSVTTLNDSMHNSKNSPFLHIKTTTTEQAFDIFTIDFKNHKIYSTRIGCGEDRVFEYTTI